MPWPKTGESQYHAQLGLPDKGLIVIHKWEVGASRPLALRCPTPVPYGMNRMSDDTSAEMFEHHSNISIYQL